MDILGSVVRKRCLTTALMVTTAIMSVSMASAASAAAQTQLSQANARAFNVPGQPLASALLAFGQQSQLQLSVDSALVRDVVSPGVAGSMTAGEALTRLLSGTGLTHRIDGDTVTLQRVSAAPGSSNTMSSAAPLVIAPVGITEDALRDAGSTEGTGAYTGDAVTIGKSALSLRETPQAVSIITRQRLDDQAITDVGDALRYTTGMTVQSQGGAYTDYSAQARGSSADYQSDGLNVGIDSRAAQYDLAIYDRIEVLRGPAGLFKGAGSAGATINLVRKRARESFQMGGVATGGSWGTYRFEADVGGALNESGTVRGRVVGMTEDRGTHLDNTDNKKHLIYGTVEFDLSDATTIAVGAIRQSATMQYFFGLPAYTTGQLVSTSRSRSYTAPWSSGLLLNFDLFAEVDHRFDNGGTFKAVARRAESSRDAKSLFSGGGLNAAGFQSLGANAEDIDNENVAFDGYYSTPVEAFGQTHNVLFGADYSKLETDTLRRAPAIPGTYDFFNFNAANIPEPLFDTAPLVANLVQKTTSYGVYSQARIKPVEPLTLVGGLRLSWRDVRDWNRNTNVRTSGPDVSAKFTPYAAAIFDVAPTVSLYSSYTEVFQPQSATTVAGEVLPPIIGAQYEAGVKGEFFDKRLNAHLAVYRMIRSNEAVADPNNPGSSLADGKRRAQGFEAEITGQLTPGWNVTTGYAYTTTKILVAAAASNGLPFSPSTPKHNFTLWSQYTFLDGALSGADIGVGLRAMSRFYNVQNFYGEAFTVAAMAVGYRINDRVKATINIENLFDKSYYAKVGNGTANNYYGAPRSFMFTVRANY